jgi:hypothetical protein
MSTELSTLDNSNHILTGWIRAAKMPSAVQQDDFHAFASWCKFYDVPMPATGEDIADYLMDILVDGKAVFDDLARIAASITACYEHRRCPLDQSPIKAALALAADQLSPNRVIN